MPVSRAPDAANPRAGHVPFMIRGSGGVGETVGDAGLSSAGRGGVCTVCGGRLMMGIPLDGAVGDAGISRLFFFEV